MKKLLFTILIFVATAFAEDYYVSPAGDDSSSGLPGNSWKTIQHAADSVSAGDVVHILPGIYRENIIPPTSGTTVSPIIFRGETDSGNVEIRGTENFPFSDWRQANSDEFDLPSGIDFHDVYVLELSDWTYDDWLGTHDYASDLFIEIDGGTTTRYHRACEPDWEVPTWFKWHEQWWIPSMSGTSKTLMTDATDDTDLEPGNLGDFTNLKNATVFVLGNYYGHYLHRRWIDDFSKANSRITLDHNCQHDSGAGSLGPKARYYLENDSEFMDNPGEWIKTGTGNSQKIAVLTGATFPTSKLSRIEIGKRYFAFNLYNKKDISFENINFFGIDRGAWNYDFSNPEAAIVALNEDDQITENITIKNCNFNHCINGIHFAQDIDLGNVIKNTKIQNCNFFDIDNFAISFEGWGISDLSEPAGSENILIENSNFNWIGLRPLGDFSVGINIATVNKVIFRNNFLENIGHNALMFYDPRPGNVLVENNVFKKCLLYGTDAGAVKFHGGPWSYDTDFAGVFTNSLVIGNQFYDILGWSYTHEQTMIDSGYRHSQLGMESYGVYMDLAGGISCFKNFFYNIGTTAIGYENNYRGGQNFVYNNTIYNTQFGVHVGRHISNIQNPKNWVDTRIEGNIFAKCESGNVFVFSAPDCSFNTSSQLLTAPGLTINKNFHKQTFPNPFPTNQYFSDSDYKPSDLYYTDSDWSYYTYGKLNGIADFNVVPLTPFGDNGIDWSNNLPLFLNESGDSPLDFQLDNSSPAVNSSPVPTPVLNLINRLEIELGTIIDSHEPADGQWDMGAFEDIPEPFLFINLYLLFIIYYFRKNSKG